MGIVGSIWHLMPKTWEESHSPEHPVVGKQTQVRAAEPGEAENLPRSLSLPSRKNWGVPTWTSTRAGENLQKSGHMDWTFQQEIGTKSVRARLVTAEVVVKCSQAPIPAPPPRPQETRHRVNNLLVATSPSRKRGTVSRRLATLIILVMAGETCFSPEAPRILRKDLHDLGWAETGGKGR